MSNAIKCFKAYDVRGRIPDELNDDIAYRIGRGYAKVLQPKKVIVGYDIRLTSVAISTAVINGLRDEGVDVYCIGLCGTEEVYFATSHEKMDGGIAVTASHNPKDYNGMKFVREESKPISGDTGLFDIQAAAERNEFSDAPVRGQLIEIDTRPAYVQHLLTYVSGDTMKPLKLVATAGNGGASIALDAIEPELPIEFIKVHHQPDGNFPNGVPNPLLEENRRPTAEAVVANKADFGIAWDGDFDRCFFFDETGAFIEGYYVVGLLAEAYLQKNPGESVVHDPRLTWNTVDIVETNKGVAIECKTGHAFIKERMRKENAIYGGEMSAHHYFREFAYCDSGMIPWLLVAQLVSDSGKTLSQLVAERVAAYPCSGEINSTVKDAKALIEQIETIYAGDAVSVEHTDGLSVAYSDWRFNVRMSNTEPVLRLNVESRGSVSLMKEKTADLLAIIEAQ